MFYALGSVDAMKLPRAYFKMENLTDFGFNSSSGELCLYCGSSSVKEISRSKNQIRFKCLGCNMKMRKLIM